MDTTTQYKLNKYSKKISNAYKQHNMSKVNEYMHHQFNYINKYAQQQHGGGLEEIEKLLNQIKENIFRLNKETRLNNDRIKYIEDAIQQNRELEEVSASLGGMEV